MNRSNISIKIATGFEVLKDNDQTLSMIQLQYFQSLNENDKMKVSIWIHSNRLKVKKKLKYLNNSITTALKF